MAVVAAARPNFIKIGPVIEALRDRSDVELVHTGQHYDSVMSASFFRDLGIPEPDVNLEVRSGSHSEQTAAVLVAFERYLVERQADAVVVVGDVNSTVAASLAAVKMHVPVAHVEAGLRSGDWTMPEEVNRVVTDRVSRWLFTPSEDADENLKAEGVPAEWIHLVGNVMIDTLLANLGRARHEGERAHHRLELPDRFGLVTLHRPSNVDEGAALQGLMGALGEVATQVPLVFPVHPRTAQRFRDFGVEIPTSIRTVPPMGYLDFVGLLERAALVLTDSGGIQEEASVLGTPCLTLRENTERPVTCTMGTNVLVGTDPVAIVRRASAALAAESQPASVPLWDGKAAGRIADALLHDLAFH